MLLIGIFKALPGKIDVKDTHLVFSINLYAAQSVAVVQEPKLIQKCVLLQ